MTTDAGINTGVGWNGFGRSGLNNIPLGAPGDIIAGAGGLDGATWGYRKTPYGYAAVAVGADGRVIQELGGARIPESYFSGWPAVQDMGVISTVAPPVNQTLGENGLPISPLLTNDPISGDPITNFPAPPGYSWGIDPTDNKKVLIDLTPLDKSKPPQNWHWVVNDPASPNTGSWVYAADQSDLDRTFAGVPKSVLPWLQYALNQGGSLSGVPEAAHGWLNYLINHASDAGRLRPGEVPFGLGVPDWEGPQFGGNAPTLNPDGTISPAPAPDPNNPNIDPGGVGVLNGVQQPFTPPVLPNGEINPGSTSTGPYTDTNGTLVWNGQGDAPVWNGSGPPPAWWFKQPTNLPTIPPPGGNGITQPPISQTQPIPQQNPPLHPPEIALPPPPINYPDLSQIVPRYPVATMQPKAPSGGGGETWQTPTSNQPPVGEWHLPDPPQERDPYVMNPS